MIKIIVLDCSGEKLITAKVCYLEDAERIIRKWGHGNIVEVETNLMDDLNDMKDNDAFKNVRVNYVGW